MYISCGDDGAAGVESEMGYVPNNPLFGLPLDSPQVKFVKITSYIKVNLEKLKFKKKKSSKSKFYMLVDKIVAG